MKTIYKFKFGNEEFEYQLVRKRVKNINLRIKRDGSVHVSCNSLVSIKAIENFIERNFEAIIKTINKNKAAFDSIVFKYTDGSKIVLLGKEYILKTLNGSKKVVVNTSEILVYCKNYFDSNEVKKVIDKVFNNILRQIVIMYCNEAFIKFKEFGVSYPTIKFKNMVTKWGCCAPNKHNVSFSNCLIYTPRECIEYVVYHEFNHFLFANHSKEYYNSLSRFMPDWKTRRNILNKEYSKYCIK